MAFRDLWLIEEAAKPDLQYADEPDFHPKEEPDYVTVVGTAEMWARARQLAQQAGDHELVQSIDRATGQEDL